MRVLQVFTPGAAGGLESVVQMLAPGLSRRGLEVGVTAVLIGDAAEPPSVTAIRESGVPVFLHRQGPRAYLNEWRNHRDRVAGFRPDVVHTHGYRADVLAGWATGDRARRVATVHGFTGGDWKNRMYERLQMRSYCRYDAVVAVSRTVVDRLKTQGVSGPRVALIPNAWSTPVAPLSRIDARTILGLDHEAVVVGWVGRLSAEKGCDVLLDAAARLAGLNARISVVGDGAERAGLEARTAALGLSDRVTWHGLVPAAGRLMAAFDVFTMSSRTEGTPIALFEAMAAGVPVVATAVGGVPDVLQADQGWLVPSESPDALTAAIREALTDREEARRRANRASEHLRRDYSADPWLDRHVDLYSRLTGKRAQSPC